MKITFLVDNYVDRAGLSAEHGFSALIEIGDKKILFDAGQTDIILKNIKTLSLDIESISYVVLSHGHYDHTGGLGYFFSNRKVKVFCHREIASEHLRVNPKGGYDYIGLDKEFYKKYVDNFLFNETMSRIDEGVYLSGNIGRFEEFDSDKNLYISKNGEYLKDHFPDEQYLILSEDENYHLITGCSHAGIVNIILDFRKKFGNVKLKSISGGFHLFRSSIRELERVLNFLIENNIEYIITGHCTGIDAICHFKNRLDERLIPIKVGLVVEV